MKLTKYPQACVLVETNGKKILVDPGCLDYDERFLEKWKEADIILLTHKHADHVHMPAIEKLEGKIYTSKEVQEEYPELKAETVKEGDVIEEDGTKIEVVKAVHGYMPFLKGGKEVLENIGFIIDGEKRVYLTSDTICFPNEYKCDVVFVPVCNHGLVMGPFEAALFAKETGAELVIPYHYDNPKFPADMQKVKKEFEKQRLNYKVLAVEEQTEI